MKSIAWRAFSKFLKEKGYSEITKSGNKSTTYDYPSRIERICKREKFESWELLGEQILDVVKKYSLGGAEEKYGAQSNGSNLKALELFQEFYISF